MSPALENSKDSCPRSGVRVGRATRALFASRIYGVPAAMLPCAEPKVAKGVRLVIFVCPKGWNAVTDNATVVAPLIGLSSFRLKEPSLLRCSSPWKAPTFTRSPMRSPTIMPCSEEVSMSSSKSNTACPSSGNSVSSVSWRCCVSCCAATSAFLPSRNAATCASILRSNTAAVAVLPLPRKVLAIRCEVSTAL